MRQRKHSESSLLWRNFLTISSILPCFFKTFTKCSVFDYESIETCRKVILVGTLPSYIYNNILNLSINAIFAMFESYNFWWFKILNLKTCFQFSNLRRLRRSRIVFDEVSRYHHKSPLDGCHHNWGRGLNLWPGVSSRSQPKQTSQKVLTQTVGMVHSMKPQRGLMSNYQSKPGWH